MITKRNKERILKLIDELVECEAEATAVVSSSMEILSSIESSQSLNFTEMSEFEGISLAKANVKESKVGSWGMFNSYVPGKASLRVLLHLLKKDDGKPIRYWDFVDECVAEFWKVGLRYRGFPKKTTKSAKGRLAMHLIWPFYEMGLLSVSGEKSNPLVAITKEGLEFTTLSNPLLDRREKEKPLSAEEQKWLLSHLEKIDKDGYKELTVFEDLVTFLSEGERGFKDIVSYFEENKEFKSWVLEGSRHKDSPKAFARQMRNMSRTFASGKIALLRELGIVSSARATYRVISQLKPRKDY